MIVRELDFEHPHSASLRAAQRAEIAERYGTPDSEPGTPPTAADMTVFVVAYIDDAPAACGGLRRLDAEHGELKRMFVSPERRGSGVAVAVLGYLERYAREAGWARVVLETGDRQPDAMRFYEREGYRRIPNFGSYVGVDASRCYEKRL